MRIIPAEQLERDPGLWDEVIEVLRDDGLVCFPGRRQYCIAASLFSENAVVRLVQSKRRSEKAPSLVLIPDRKMLLSVAQEVPPLARPLLDAFWPGPLTLLAAPSEQIPSKVLKTLATKKKLTKIGIRIPESSLTQRLVKAFGGPLLISSANLSNKIGASSVSHVRKDFAHTVDLLIEAGDLPARTPSTVVDVDSGMPQVTREGMISSEQIRSVLQNAGLLAS